MSGIPPIGAGASSDKPAPPSSSKSGNFKGIMGGSGGKSMDAFKSFFGADYHQFVQGMFKQIISNIKQDESQAKKTQAKIKERIKQG